MRRRLKRSVAGTVRALCRADRGRYNPKHNAGFVDNFHAELVTSFQDIRFIAHDIASKANGRETSGIAVGEYQPLGIRLSLAVRDIEEVTGHYSAPVHIGRPRNCRAGNPASRSNSGKSRISTVWFAQVRTLS